MKKHLEMDIDKIDKGLAMRSHIVAACDMEYEVVFLEP